MGVSDAFVATELATIQWEGYRNALLNLGGPRSNGIVRCLNGFTQDGRKPPQGSFCHGRWRFLRVLEGMKCTIAKGVMLEMIYQSPVSIGP